MATIEEIDDLNIEVISGPASEEDETRRESPDHSPRAGIVIGEIAGDDDSGTNDITIVDTTAVILSSATKREAEKQEEDDEDDNDDDDDVIKMLERYLDQQLPIS